MGKKKSKKIRRKQNQRDATDFGPEEILQHFEIPKCYDLDPERPGHLVLHRRNKTQTILDKYWNRGIIKDRQWKAGDRLRTRMRMAGLDAFVTVDLLKIGGQAPSFMIPTSEAMASARQEIRKTFSALGKPVTRVLMALVHDDIDLLESELPCKNNEVQKRAAAAATVKIVLETLADYYGEPYDRSEARA